VWLVFFDKYNFFAQTKLKRSTQKLEKEYAEILENIELAKQEQKDLNLNQEKYGREKYYLHKDDEDVFIIEKSIK
jgi:cell division protein FtsB